MSNWPVVTLALSLAFVAAYVIADVAARALESVLRSIVADQTIDRPFVQGPRRVIRLAVFLMSGAALAVPALRLGGIRLEIGTTPDAIARWALDAGVRIILIAVMAYVVIRIGSAAARRFEREMSTGTGLDVIERTKRAQTLGRLLQKTLTVTVSSMAGLMILRELDVDITPVLTGAGIVGLAVGFGAQTLVRDVISGFFLIVEDQVRVGDVAVVNGQGGLIEEVNLRTLVLRDDQGAVHVYPNGEVKTLANLSKDFSYYVITVGIGYDDDPETVIGALHDAGATLMTDANFKQHILSPLEVHGVDDFKPDQITIKARIKTVPLKQWLVGRELRKRVAAMFRERGIRAPVPQMNVRVEGIEGLLAARRALLSAAEPDKRI